MILRSRAPHEIFSLFQNAKIDQKIASEVAKGKVAISFDIRNTKYDIRNSVVYRIRYPNRYKSNYPYWYSSTCSGKLFFDFFDFFFNNFLLFIGPIIIQYGSVFADLCIIVRRSIIVSIVSLTRSMDPLMIKFDAMRRPDRHPDPLHILFLILRVIEFKDRHKVRSKITSRKLLNEYG